MNTNILLLIFSVSIFSLNCSQIESKLQMQNDQLESDYKLKLESQYNHQKITSLLTYSDKQKIDQIFAQVFDTGVTPELQNIILNYLIAYFNAGEYNETDKNELYHKMFRDSIFSDICGLKDGTVVSKLDKDIILKNLEIKFVKILPGHSEIIRAIIELPNNCLASSDRNCIKIWNLENYECQVTLNPKYTSKYLLSLPNEYLASASDYAIEIWNIKTSECEAIIDLQAEAISLLYSAKDGNIIVCNHDRMFKESLTLLKYAYDIIDSLKLQDNSENLQSNCNCCCSCSIQ